MKNPTRPVITRVSLTSTASHNARWFAGILAGTTVLGASISQAAINNVWVGGAPGNATNWNTPANWSLGHLPVKTGVDATTEHAVINIAAGPVLTLANGSPPSALLAIPTEIIIGTGAGTNGRLDHISGEASTGAGNHLYAGLGAGTGVFNLADTGTVVPSGNTTGFAQGSGTMNVQNQFRIGDGAGSTGTANINTTGTLTVASGIQIATNGATGRVNIDSGTINGTAGWCEVGNGANCNGRLDMSGGTLTKAGADGTSGVIIGANGATGEANIGGNASIKVTVGGGDGGAFRVANANNSKGTLNLSGNASITVNNQFYVGNGTGTTAGKGGFLNMSGGTISNTSWVAIGRSGGTGTVNMTGGTWTKTGGGTQFIVGADGPGSMAMSGGSLLDVQAGFMWVGEAGGATTAVLTISGATTYPAGPEIRCPYISVGPASPNATLNLDGGTVKTHRFGGTRDETGGTNSGNGTIKFNGSRIIATANDNAFINDVNTVQVNGGGMLIDSAGFTLSTGHTIGTAAGQVGGVTKLGAGSLTLSGTTTFTGNNTVNAGTLAFTGANLLPGTNTVNAGKLAVTTAASGNGNYVVANGATLGLTQTGAGLSLAATSTSLGASTLDVDLGNFAGLPTAPVLAAGALTLGGPVAINLVDAAPVVGSVPLISYTSKSGGGSFNTALASFPTGVIATVVDNGTNLVSLDVTRVNAPYWKGDGNGIWVSEADAVTPDGDWFEDYTEVAKNFLNGDPALFDDRVSGTTTVTLNSTVLPGGSGVRFDNTTFYTLAGTGKISGSTTFTKTNTGDVDINLENDYTGTTTLAGGTVAVTKLASSASPTAPLGKGNLVLAGGTLNYTGLTPVVTEQGFSITGSSGLTLASNVEYQGAITSTGTGSGLFKSGLGNLTLSSPGANVIGGTGQQLDVRQGTVILNGGGTQTVSVPGALFVATQPNEPANLTLSGTAVTVGGFLAIGRGNGDDGVSNLLLTNSTLNVGGFSSGYANGNTFNQSEQFITLNNSTISATGVTYFGESQGSTGQLTMNGTSQYNAGNQFILGRLGATSTGKLIMNDSSKITKTAGTHVAIGGEGAGTATMNGASQFITTSGDFNVGDVGSAVGLLDINDDATVTSAGPVFIGKNSSKGTIDMSGTSNMTGGATNVSGAGATSEGTLTVAGSAEYVAADRLLVGVGAASKGFLTVDGSGKIQVNSYVSIGYNGVGTMTVKGDGTFANNDDFSVNENGDAPVTVTVQDTGSMTVGGNLYVGRNGGRSGTLTVTGLGGEVNQTNAAAAFNVGQSGTGTLNIQGSATVTAASNNGVVLGQVSDGTGIVNLDGGTLTAKRIFGNAGTGTFNFHGGLLRAGAGATPAFFSGVDNAFVKSGGARIDSNGQTIAVGQPLLTDAVSTGGGLTKSGLGTLQLNAVNTYTGATTVTAGALGGTGTIVSPITVQTGAALAPGAATGTLTASQGVTFNAGSTFIVTVDDSQAADNSRLDTTGTLNVSGVNLQVNVVGGAGAAPYTIATAGNVTGTFASVTPGTSVVYNATSITITPPAGTPFQSWISGFAVGGLNQPGDDADFDGMTNLEEFALDGNPANGNSTGKVRSRIELVAGQSALVITLPVRTGATFDNTPGPGADASIVADDLTYLIRGSNDLSAFDQGVSEIAVSAADMPPLSDNTKWGYRTFRLNGVVPTRGSKGFLQVVVTDIP